MPASLARGVRRYGLGTSANGFSGSHDENACTWARMPAAADRSGPDTTNRIMTGRALVARGVLKAVELALGRPIDTVG